MSYKRHSFLLHLSLSLSLLPPSLSLPPVSSPLELGYHVVSQQPAQHASHVSDHLGTGSSIPSQAFK